jgi:hypothetical protein
MMDQIHLTLDRDKTKQAVRGVKLPSFIGYNETKITSHDMLLKAHSNESSLSSTDLPSYKTSVLYND